MSMNGVLSERRGAFDVDVMVTPLTPSSLGGSLFSLSRVLTGSTGRREWEVFKSSSTGFSIKTQGGAPAP